MSYPIPLDALERRLEKAQAECRYFDRLLEVCFDQPERNEADFTRLLTKAHAAQDELALARRFVREAREEAKQAEAEDFADWEAEQPRPARENIFTRMMRALGV